MFYLGLQAGCLSLLVALATPHMVSAQARPAETWPDPSNGPHPRRAAAAVSFDSARSMRAALQIDQDEERSDGGRWKNAAIGALIGAGVAGGGTALLLELFGPEVPYSPPAVIGMAAVFGGVVGAVLGLASGSR